MPTGNQVLVATGVTFYHQKDEAAFFEWLGRMQCVERFEGESRDLFIHLSRAPTDADLRELTAFFYRYGIDMHQLARFGTGAKRAWFREPETYWHRGVFRAADTQP